MIEKMKFLSIIGPKGDIDRVVDRYLSRYPIHLENALAELSSVRDLSPFIQVNPYREWLNKAAEFCEILGEEESEELSELTAEEAIDVLKQMDQIMQQRKPKLDSLLQKRNEKRELLRELSPFRVISSNLSELLKFKFVKYRFGRIPKAYYQKFLHYTYDDLDMIFYKCEEKGDYVWGVYFVPHMLAESVDAVLASLHFERIYISDAYQGTAEEAYAGLKKECGKLNKQIKKYQEENKELLSKEAAKIRAAKLRLESMTENFEIRKLAACTRERQKTFYILCGWMTERDAEAFQKEIVGDNQIYCFVEDAANNVYATPPTKLKNPWFVRPFEMFIRMYGLPSYNEIDPTMMVAFLYAFIFGVMFGDLGQGLCLVAGGFALYKWKKMDLAAIVGTAGIFSSIFGVMFGSVFGFENVIPALWLRPREEMMNLPFIGSLNTVFVVAIAFGMFLILVMMVLHIVNALKAGKKGDALFDTNGVAGLVFYAVIVAVVFLYMSGHALPATALLVIFLGVPLLVLALKEPLTRKMEGEWDLIVGSKAMFVMQTFFEMFETMLSYFSNTLSFVRVGAFAVSHAAMMEVVLMLAGAENGGSPNWLVIVLGNLLVCGLEGLIVGIQVLRLTYYEMFSRFYRGGGREFVPFGKKRNAA